MQWLCRRMGWRLRGRLAAEAMSRRWLVEDDEGRHAEARGGRRAAADADADAATAGVVSTPEARYPVLHMLKPGVPVAPPARGPSVVSLIMRTKRRPSRFPGNRVRETLKCAGLQRRQIGIPLPRGAAPRVARVPYKAPPQCARDGAWGGARGPALQASNSLYALSLLASKNCILLKP